MAELYVGTPNGVQKFSAGNAVKCIDIGTISVNSGFNKQFIYKELIGKPYIDFYYKGNGPVDSSITRVIPGAPVKFSKYNGSNTTYVYLGVVGFNNETGCVAIENIVTKNNDTYNPSFKVYYYE